MIRLERDPTFWRDVAQDPSVAALLAPGAADFITGLIAKPGVLPIAAQDGGFIFSQLDDLGRVAELHTMFKPAAWFPARQVYEAARDAFHLLFEGGARPGGALALPVVQIIVTYETQANPRSRPPISFGFEAVGDFEPSPLGPMKTWILRRPAWRASKVGRRMCQ